jgi:hypothetical protein
MPRTTSRSRASSIRRGRLAARGPALRRAPKRASSKCPRHARSGGAPTASAKCYVENSCKRGTDGKWYKIVRAGKSRRWQKCTAEEQRKLNARARAASTKKNKTSSKAKKTSSKKKKSAKKKKTKSAKKKKKSHKKQKGMHGGFASSQASNRVALRLKHALFAGGAFQRIRLSTGSDSTDSLGGG